MSVKTIIAILLVVHLVGIVHMIFSGDTSHIFAAGVTSLFLGAMLWSLNKNNRKRKNI